MAYQKVKEMNTGKDGGGRSLSPHRGQNPAGARASFSTQPGQIPGSLNILSSILRSPHPNLQPGIPRSVAETGRGQSPIRVITSLPPSVVSAISPGRGGLSPSRTPTTLPPKKSLSPSRLIYSERQSPSPRSVRTADPNVSIGQGRQVQGQLLSHLPYLAQTLQEGISHERIFQQYRGQTGVHPSHVSSAAGMTMSDMGSQGSIGRQSPLRNAQPLPAHQRVPSPSHVTTIRRTPSPAHMPIPGETTARVVVAHTGTSRPQPVNLIKASLHQAKQEQPTHMETDFKIGDLLQSINRSQENIQSHLLQGGLSPITPADPITTKPWSAQIAPRVVPVSSVQHSLGHGILGGDDHVSLVSLGNTISSAHAVVSVTPTIGFTPVVLPSKTHQSRTPHRGTGISPSVHQPAVCYSMVSSAAQSISVTEPGPPNITISVCGSIPSQDRPVQKHPRNPFTFPATPPVSLTNERPAIGVGIMPVGQSRLTESKALANEKSRHKSDDMPQLSPVKKVEVKKEYDEDLVAIPNAYNMRLQTLANFPNNPVYRPTYRATSVAIHKAKVGCITNPAKSLDVLRQNLQKSINKEISAIIQSYMDKYFKMGIENIKLNNGENSVTDDHVQAVCRQMLEEAKKMYLSETGRRSVSPARELSDNVSETGSTGRRSALGRRRHPSDTDSEASLRPAVTANKKKKGRYIVNLTGRSTPSKLAMLQSKREGPKFDPERLTEETLFVMGSKANKAMGFGATRGRLYMKHPELFKYGGDQDDKTWLYEHQHMPATGGKSYLIVLDDVRDLALNDEYRDSPGITVEALSGFAVPIWMIEKMRIQMVAMRTDLPKQTKYRSRSTTPNEATHTTGDLNDEESHPKEIKDLPFASFSSPKPGSNLLEASPADEDLDFLSNTGNSNTPTQMSPFNMTGGFDDSVSQSDLDNIEDDPTFQINK